MKIKEKKLCPHCKKSKPIKAFGYRKDKPNVTQSWCSTCKAEKMKAWIQNNREKYNKYQREYSRKKKLKTNGRDNA